MFLPAAHDENKGFTLIEVMVAIIIMMIGMLALLQTVNMAIAYNRSNKIRNDAVIYADEAIGRERVRAFSEVITSNNLITHKTGLGYVNYSVVNRVTDLTGHSLDPASGDNIAGAKNLQVTVSWRDKGIKKTHSLTTTIIEKAN